MSEHLLKILLGELTTVRIVCQGSLPDGKKCGAVSEISIDRLDMQALRCPFCEAEFHVADPVTLGKLSPFGPLAKSIKQLVAMKDRVQIEFVIPAEKQP